MHLPRHERLPPVASLHPSAAPSLVAEPDLLSEPHATTTESGRRLYRAVVLLVALRPQAVQEAVRLAHLAHEAADRHRRVVTHVHTIRVDVGNVNLHSRLVVGHDQTVGGGALPGDVQVDVDALGVDHTGRHG